MFNQQPKGYKMGLKQWIRNWLGINQPHNKRYGRMRQHVIGLQYVQPSNEAQKIAFWDSQRRKGCINAKEFYAYCGGYEVMNRLLRQDVWFSHHKNGAQPPIFIVFDKMQPLPTSGNGYRSRSMRCATPYKANLLAADILKIHNTERKRRGLEPIHSKQPIAFLTN